MLAPENIPEGVNPPPANSPITPESIYKELIDAGCYDANGDGYIDLRDYKILVPGFKGFSKAIGPGGGPRDKNFD